MTTQLTVDRDGVVVSAEKLEPKATPASAYAGRADHLVEYRKQRYEALINERRQRLDAVASRAGTYRERVTDEDLACWVLRVDQEDYQRRRNEDKVLDIAYNFDWNKFGRIKVNRRPDGTLWVVDGQHRVEAVELLWGSDYVVPCEVISVAGSAAEADIFVDTNTKRTGLSNENKFRAKLTARRSDAVELVQAVAQYGLAIRTTRRGGNARNVPGEIVSSQMLNAIRKQGGLFALHCVLTTCRQAFGLDPDGYRMSMLEGVWHFLLRYHGEYNHKRLVTIMRLKRPIGVFREAAFQQGGDDAITTTRYNGQTMALALHGIYTGQRRAAFPLSQFVVDSRPFGPTMRGLLASWRTTYGIDPVSVNVVDDAAVAKQAAFLNKITKADAIPGLVLDPGRSPTNAD